MSDYDDRCYECTGYGDDYYFDEEKGEYVKACDECSYNGDDDTDYDYERAVDQLEYDIRWEPTFNPDDGSM